MYIRHVLYRKRPGGRRCEVGLPHEIGNRVVFISATDVDLEGLPFELLPCCSSP